jgi:hypothetical protein
VSSLAALATVVEVSVSEPPKLLNPFDTFQPGYVDAMIYMFSACCEIERKY